MTNSRKNNFAETFFDMQIGCFLPFYFRNFVIETREKLTDCLL